MAMIIHRCTTCQHPDQFHASTETENDMGCSHGWCNLSRHIFGPPEVIPTWGPNGELQEDLIEPGSRVRGFPHHTCDCDACVALYRQFSYQAAA